jgi:hypothetical protein
MSHPIAQPGVDCLCLCASQVAEHSGLHRGEGGTKKERTSQVRGKIEATI